MNKEIYDILVETCGASESARKQFYAVWPCDEFRFQGELGFGGKIRKNNDKIYVDYYPEDRSDEREMMCAAANYALKRIERMATQTIS